MILELKNIEKNYGAVNILTGICLSVDAGDRIGLLGVNGAGKSTLLSIITGELDYDDGELGISSNCRIGYLKQHGAVSTQRTIAEEMDSVFAEVHEVERRLEKLRLLMAGTEHNGPQYEQLMSEYDSLNAEFEAHDGYNIPLKINTVLEGMGFGNYDRNMITAQLSGGEKTRLALAKLLLEEPNLLILDEPTNHLDFAMLSWLEDYLSAWKGALIVVSHDRYFLDKVVTSICEIEFGKLTRYSGGYSSFINQKEERIAFQEKQYEKQQEEIEKLEDYIAKNIVRASTANMAKSRIHMLEHMERIEKPTIFNKRTKLKFATDAEPYKDVLIADKISISVGEGNSKKELCHNLSLHILKGEKVALIGLNGVGKTSLLKAVMNRIEYQGRVMWGTNVKISYFEQENKQLNPLNTVIDELHNRFPRKNLLELRTLLGGLLFSGDDIYKTIGELSGGERAKVAFAIIMLERANVLILDEPTNHLDYMTKEILEKALSEYEGTILMVSHDRYMLNRVPTRIIEMFSDNILSYDGGYDYYLENKQSYRVISEKSETSEKKSDSEQAKEGFFRSKEMRAKEAKKRARISFLEKEIERLEAETDSLEKSMSSDEVTSDYKKLQEVCDTIEANRKLISEYSDEWITLSE